MHKLWTGTYIRSVFAAANVIYLYLNLTYIYRLTHQASFQFHIKKCKELQGRKFPISCPHQKHQFEGPFKGFSSLINGPQPFNFSQKFTSCLCPSFPRRSYPLNLIWSLLRFRSCCNSNTSNPIFNVSLIIILIIIKLSLYYSGWFLQSLRIITCRTLSDWAKSLCSLSEESRFVQKMGRPWNNSSNDPPGVKWFGAAPWQKVS